MLAVLLIAAAVFPANAAVTCDSGPHAGGDWPSYGHDLRNTRSQDQETLISTQNVASLEPAWAFDAARFGDEGGQLQGTPVVADGCVYVGTSTGNVFALDAQTGQLVWRTTLDGRPPTDTIYGGLIVGSVAVSDGLVYAMVNNDPEPYAVALDQHTGAIVWQTTVDRFDPPGTQINASPVIYDGLFLLTEAGPDADARARPKIIVLDATTGDILSRATTLPEDAIEDGYAGGGIWATPVVDVATGYAYAGTSNSYSKVKEHEYSNAIVKIDLDPDRPSFGTVVDSYKGTPENLIEGAYDNPVCQTLGNDPRFWYAYQFSAACLQLDLDFGASPNLFTDVSGRTVVGELQKSGVYHAVYADSMDRAWATTVSAASPAGNAASTAIDGDSVFVAANAGAVFSLHQNSGIANWASVVADSLRYMPVSLANGVLYAMDAQGSLNALDAATGILLASRSLSAATGEGVTAGFTSNGIAIARNTVFAAANSTTASGVIVAYRLID